MSKSQKTKRNTNPAPPAANGRRFPRSAIVLALLLVAAGIFLWNKGRQNEVPSAVVPPAAVGASNEPAPATTTSNPVFEKLKGKWMRPDGGYIVDVRDVESGGKMDVAYYNPKPIHVSKAEASQEGAFTKVFIELRDVNYPGSTYNLVYETDKDQLSGIYYQAALQQRFEVLFVRAQ